MTAARGSGTPIGSLTHQVSVQRPAPKRRVGAAYYLTPELRQLIDTVAAELVPEARENFLHRVDGRLRLRAGTITRAMLTKVITKVLAEIGANLTITTGGPP